MKALKYITAILLSYGSLAAAQSMSYSNLSINLSVEESITVSDTVTFNIAVENKRSPNASFQEVATNPIVTVQLPPGSTDISSADCVQVSQLALQCELAEIGVEESVSVSVTAALNNAGYQLVAAVIEADNIRDGSEADSELITVQLQTEELAPVDLAVEVSADGDNEIGLFSIGYATAVVRNTHPENTAYFPVVELEMPQGLEFYSGKYCAESDETVICRLPALAPQSETELIIGLDSKSIDSSAELNFVVNSTQPDVQTDDNEVALIFALVSEVLCGASNPQCFGGPNATDATGNADNPDVSEETADTQQVEETPEPQLASGNSANGGGVISMPWLWLLVWLKFGAQLWRRCVFAHKNYAIKSCSGYKQC